MASTRRKREGYEPAKGFPDPEAPKGPPAGTLITHMPHANGTVCGRKETKAGAYTLDRPTCEKCRRYYDALQPLRAQAARATASAAASTSAAAPPAGTTSEPA